MGLLFKQGYQEWSKNRSFEQYCIDNSKEDTIGTRYVLDKDGEIVCSAIVIRFKDLNNRAIYGIGSVLTPRNHRGKGYASKFLRECLNLINKKDNIIFLYSDINPSFYQKFNFKVLPASLQKHKKSICMVLCKDDVWNELLKCTFQTIPNYF